VAARAIFITVRKGREMEKILSTVFKTGSSKTVAARKPALKYMPTDSSKLTPKVVHSASRIVPCTREVSLSAR
jgi:hypothetical protein